MALEPVLCPTCGNRDVVKQGQSGEGKQRYKCPNSECCRCTFIQTYAYRGSLPEVKQQIADMAVNGSGIRDTAHVLKISRITLMEPLKKACYLKAVNEQRLAELEATQTIVCLCQWQDLEAQADEMWSYVGSKQQQRWLWHAIDHDTGEVLADVLSNHQGYCPAPTQSLVRILWYHAVLHCLRSVPQA